jgi:hypothetical protein
MSHLSSDSFDPWCCLQSRRPALSDDLLYVRNVDAAMTQTGVRIASCSAWRHVCKRGACGQATSRRLPPGLVPDANIEGHRRPQTRTLLARRPPLTIARGLRSLAASGRRPPCSWLLRRHDGKQPWRGLTGSDSGALWIARIAIGVIPHEFLRMQHSVGEPPL